MTFITTVKKKKINYLINKKNSSVGKTEISAVTTTGNVETCRKYVITDNNNGSDQFFERSSVKTG